MKKVLPTTEILDVVAIDSERSETRREECEDDLTIDDRSPTPLTATWPGSGITPGPWRRPSRSPPSLRSLLWTGQWYLDDLSDLADRIGSLAVFALAWGVWPALIAVFLYRTVTTRTG